MSHHRTFMVAGTPVNFQKMLQETGISGRKVYSCLNTNVEPAHATSLEDAMKQYLGAPMDSEDEVQAVKALAVFFTAETEEEAAVDITKYSGSECL